MVLHTARAHQLSSPDRGRRIIATILPGAAFFLFAADVRATDPVSAAREFQRTFPAANEPMTAAETTADGTPTPPHPPADFAGQDGFVALFDGRVISGKVMAAPGGYLLKRKGASDEMIPHFLVQTASDSLTGCYENLRDANRTPRPDDHLKLADWCLRQKLIDEARTEVVSALKLDPNRREARDLLVRIEEFTNPKPRNQESEAAPLRTAEGFLQSGIQTTEGLSPAATSLYVRRVQPILTSKCGNAACHGGTSGGQFHLTHVRRSSTSTRTSTLENLREVLSFVDQGDAAKTRLLTALDTPAHANVFSGSAGAAQQASLREWLQTATGDLGLQTAPSSVEAVAKSPVRTRESIALASAERPDTTPNQAPEQRSGLRKAAQPPRLQKVKPNDAVAEQVLRDERPDPFDPDEFNRMVIRPGIVP
jgi:hypothetical protein